MHISQKEFKSALQTNFLYDFLANTKNNITKLTKINLLSITSLQKCKKLTAHIDNIILYLLHQQSVLKHAN